jgi:hypothetical protein
MFIYPRSWDRPLTCFIFYFPKKMYGSVMNLPQCSPIQSVLVGIYLIRDLVLIIAITLSGIFMISFYVFSLWMLNQGIQPDFFLKFLVVN